MLQNIFVHFNKSNKFINLINLKQQILSILLALGKSVSFTWMLGSVCVFIKLCACFQALCMFSGSVHVFKLCALFSSSVHVFKLCACFQALCVFSSSVRVFKLCACFHYLKSILFLFCIISYICKTGNSGIWIFPCFLDSDFCFSVMYFFLLMLTFLPV